MNCEVNMFKYIYPSAWLIGVAGSMAVMALLQGNTSTAIVVFVPIGAYLGSAMVRNIGMYLTGETV